ncbi:S8 family serine peptidase [Micromonospora inositola]|uniref:Bacillopeptidase F n=1 Tax=Micromonospora inositola TaxID=47865 RepID=A0A1C5K2L6_9ACTN|nr:S8 family serine peptidase [Micromonospora inositola]SCG77060.1 bacillopeptidase F [Micromonospora inositola]
MKRKVMAAALVTALVAPATAGLPVAASPAEAGPTASAGRAGMVKAIVVLRSQLNPSTVVTPSRRQRQVALVRALRARAAADQTGVLGLLARRRAQGLVADAVPLWVVNAVAVVAQPSVIAELAARPDVREIGPDRTVQAPPSTVGSSTADAPVEPNVEAVNAPALWSLGLTGQGTVVATMDTGVDGSHPELAASWRGGSNSWYDPNGEHPAVPTDVNGHGTATMGVMVGGSAGGTSIGVAPGAKWIAVKIFNDRGSTTTSRIHLGFQWLLDPDGNPATPDAPDVVNNSWSGSIGGCNLDFQPDLRNLRAAGIMPVFSAGNYGPDPSTVLSPANNPEALAVGAADDAGVIDPSSSRGPSACDQAIAPRLSAPGVGVRTTDLYGGYRDASGTSLAAPHVAGVLALLLGAFPDLNADRQQGALESTAVDLGELGPDNTYGYGRVDALAAYQWLSTAPDFSVMASPSEAMTVPGGGVTYTVAIAGVNGFADDVALALGGLSGTQATWTITPAAVAGGTGSARVAVTTAPTIAAGTYPLTLTATSGGLSRPAVVLLVVTAPPDFGLAATPTSASVVAGSSACYTMGVTGLNGFTGTVAMSLGGVPDTVRTASFSPSVVVGSGSATLTIGTSGSAPPGTYALTVTGTSGSTSHSIGITLVVTPAPGFSLTISPSSATVLRGHTATYTVSTSAVGGSTGAVALSTAGLPAGSSASFTPNPVSASGASTLRVSTTNRTPRGTFTMLITGTSGSVVHQATATLVVR